MTLAERLAAGRQPEPPRPPDLPVDPPRLPEWRRRALERAKGRRWVAVADKTVRLP